LRQRHQVSKTNSTVLENAQAISNESKVAIMSLAKQICKIRLEINLGNKCMSLNLITKILHSTY